MILFKKTILFLLLSFFVFSISPNFIYAAKDSGGLVPCAGDSTYANRCTLCDLLVGIRDIVAWGKNILIILAILAIVIGAIMYIISAGDSGAMESAKNVIKQALWGVVIVLGAWLIVNTVLWLFAKKADLGIGVTNWYDFQCDANGGSGGGGGGTVPDGPTICTSFIYSTWSECENGSQFRIITSQRPSGCSGGSPGPLTQVCTPDDDGDEKIPKECQDYEDAFDQASAGDRNTKCLMVGIAMTESNCNASIPSSSHGACGIMQMKPSTANMTCEAMSANPKESILKATEIYNNYKSNISAYESKYGYDIGLDDSIAAYNAGTGDGVNSDGTKQPFALSVDCPSPITPAWQCPINPGGFKETQDYVEKVQGYQDSCLGK